MGEVNNTKGHITNHKISVEFSMGVTVVICREIFYINILKKFHFKF